MEIGGLVGVVFHNVAHGCQNFLLPLIARFHTGSNVTLTRLPRVRRTHNQPLFGHLGEGSDKVWMKIHRYVFQHFKRHDQIVLLQGNFRQGCVQQVGAVLSQTFK